MKRTRNTLYFERVRLQRYTSFKLANEPIIDCTLFKLHKTYFNKCMELASLQQQVLISSHDDNASISASTLVGSNDSHYFSPQMVRISSDEPRLSNDSSRDDNHSITSSYLQDSSSPPHSKKNSMSGFITQMRSQLANAAAAGDLSKQTARLAKLKKESTDTGNSLSFDMSWIH